MFDLALTAYRQAEELVASAEARLDALGKADRRGRITKRGPSVLRKLLVQCAWAMLRYNRWARAVFERLSRSKARRKQAMVALARKVLVRCWAMLRDGVPWRADPEPAAVAA